MITGEPIKPVKAWKVSDLIHGYRFRTTTMPGWFHRMFTSEGLSIAVMSHMIQMRDDEHAQFREATVDQWIGIDDDGNLEVFDQDPLA